MANLQKKAEYDELPKYSYKDHTYELIGECMIKDSLTRNWNKGVIYKSEGGQVYAREATEFYRKFKLID